MVAMSSAHINVTLTISEFTLHVETIDGRHQQSVNSLFVSEQSMSVTTVTVHVDTRTRCHSPPSPRTFFDYEMENVDLIIIIIVFCIVFGVVLNYNTRVNMFGTNLIVVGILAFIGVKTYQDQPIL